jgi:hypothetical protein
VSSRQIKALIEQITGTSCLPHRQIPTSKGFSKHSSGCFSSDLAKPPRIKDLNRTQLTTRPLFTPSPNHPQTPFPNNHPTPPLINLPRPNNILPRRIRNSIISIRTVRTRCPNSNEGGDTCRPTISYRWSRGFREID